MNRTQVAHGGLHLRTAPALIQTAVASAISLVFLAHDQARAGACEQLGVDCSGSYGSHGSGSSGGGGNDGPSYVDSAYDAEHEGFAALHAGDYKGAIAIFSKGIRLSYLTLTQFSDAAHLRGRMQRGLDEAKARLNGDSSNVDAAKAANSRGVQYFRSGDYFRAFWCQFEAALYYPDHLYKDNLRIDLRQLHKNNEPLAKHVEDSAKTVENDKEKLLKMEGDLDKDYAKLENQLNLIRGGRDPLKEVSIKDKMQSNRYARDLTQKAYSTLFDRLDQSSDPTASDYVETRNLAEQAYQRLGHSS